MGVIVGKIGVRGYYLISIREYDGDYTCMCDEHIRSRINLPVENKLELIGVLEIGGINFIKVYYNL